MKKYNPITLIGVFLTVFFILSHFLSATQYVIPEFFKTFLHLPSVCIVLLGLIAGALKCGFPQAKEVFFDISSDNKLDHQRIKTSQNAIVTISQFVWLFCVIGAIFNYFTYNKGIQFSPGEFFPSLKYALYPLIYGIIASNIILLNLATYLERKEITMPEGLRKRLNPNQDTD